MKQFIIAATRLIAQVILWTFLASIFMQAQIKRKGCGDPRLRKRLTVQITKKKETPAADGLIRASLKFVIQHYSLRPQI